MYTVLKSYNKNSLTEKGVVLDLDETLLHSYPEDEFELRDLNIMSNPKLLDLRSRTYVLNIDTNKGSDNPTIMWGIKRPHVDEFLNFCFTYFRVVIVYTAGIHEYGHAAQEVVFKNSQEPHAILTRGNCDPVGKNYEKPFWKILKEVPELDPFFIKDGSPKEIKNVLIIDDRAVSFKQNPNNGILIPAYEPDATPESLRKDDLALIQIMTWLKRPDVMNAPDVRKLDKSRIFSTQQSVVSYTPTLGTINKPITMQTGHPVNKIIPKNEIQKQKLLAGNCINFFLH